MLASSFESLRTSAGSPEPRAKRPGHKRMSSLPQHGYPAATSFATLVEDNPFVFRVYTPKRKMRTRAMSDPFFMGAKYNEDEDEFFSDAENDIGSDTGGPVRGIAKATYMDAIRHLDWKQRRSSPYISTSFSFAWAIWEANRRYQDGVKHDVHIAVIDARALLGRATTALELLNKGPSSKRHKDHHKYQRFASEAQNVLVYGCIPSTAVLASVPLLSVMPKLPSYFARPTYEVTSDLEDFPPPKEPRASTVLTPPPSPTPFAVVFRDKPTKSSYKQFCQELSDRFLLLPESARLNDTSAHAVRLAVALLRPWLHRSLLEKDTDDVEATLCSLALLIAQWPAQWWTRDNDDVDTIVRGMVQVVVQEIKETRRIHALDEVDRLQGVVDGLKRKADDLQRRQEAVSESQSMSTSVTGSSVLLPPPYSGPWVSGPVPALPKVEEAPTKTLSPVASALISGLLFGSFCMLSIIHSQRWELANHLT